MKAQKIMEITSFLEEERIIDESKDEEIILRKSLPGPFILYKTSIIIIYYYCINHSELVE